MLRFSLFVVYVRSDFSNIVDLTLILPSRLFCVVYTLGWFPFVHCPSLLIDPIWLRWFVTLHLRYDWIVSVIWCPLSVVVDLPTCYTQLIPGQFTLDTPLRLPLYIYRFTRYILPRFVYFVRLHYIGWTLYISSCRCYVTFGWLPTFCSRFLFGWFIPVVRFWFVTLLFTHVVHLHSLSYLYNVVVTLHFCRFVVGDLFVTRLLVVITIPFYDLLNLFTFGWFTWTTLIDTICWLLHLFRYTLSSRHYTHTILIWIYIGRWFTRSLFAHVPITRSVTFGATLYTTLLPRFSLRCLRCCFYYSSRLFLSSRCVAILRRTVAFTFPSSFFTFAFVHVHLVDFPVCSHILLYMPLLDVVDLLPHITLFTTRFTRWFTLIYDFIYLCVTTTFHTFTFAVYVRFGLVYLRGWTTRLRLPLRYTFHTTLLRLRLFTICSRFTLVTFEFAPFASYLSRTLFTFTLPIVFPTFVTLRTLRCPAFTSRFVVPDVVMTRLLRYSPLSSTMVTCYDLRCPFDFHATRLSSFDL